VIGARSAQHSERHSRSPPGAAVRALAGVLMLASYASLAPAQTVRPNISVATTLPVEPATQVPFPIRVGPPDAVPRGSFVRVRGLPSMAALSEGHSIAPGAWAIPLIALPNLKITLPGSAPGRSEISITLVSIDGSVLVEARSTLVIAAAPPASDVQTQGKTAAILRTGPPLQPVPEERPIPPTGASPSPDARERAMRLVKRGDEQLAEGGIAQARLLYERAAEAGLALGAMAMAATYDAAELDRLGVLGLKPDREAARRWYERARQLGSAEAEQRLRRLGAN
jgi:hypothetical protein